MVDVHTDTCRHTHTQRHINIHVQTRRHTCRHTQTQKDTHTDTAQGPLDRRNRRSISSAGKRPHAHSSFKGAPSRLGQPYVVSSLSSQFHCPEFFTTFPALPHSSPPLRTTLEAHFLWRHRFPMALPSGSHGDEVPEALASTVHLHWEFPLRPLSAVCTPARILRWVY